MFIDAADGVFQRDPAIVILGDPAGEGIDDRLFEEIGGGAVVGIYLAACFMDGNQEFTPVKGAEVFQVPVSFCGLFSQGMELVPGPECPRWAGS